jgi:hypothetical protein
MTFRFDAEDQKQASAPGFEIFARNDSVVTG